MRPATRLVNKIRGERVKMADSGLGFFFWALIMKTGRHLYKEEIP
jgi:hypothetical protein